MIGRLIAALRRVRAAFSRAALDEELEAELAAHFELKKRQLEAEGVSPAQVFRHTQAAVGQRIKPGKLPWLEITGVAANSKHHHIREAEPLTLYTPWWLERPSPGMTIAVRYSGGRAALVAQMDTLFVREAGRRPFVRVASVGDNLDESVRTERVLTMLLSAFAAFALVISATGIAGLLAYTVQQRRREIGIGLALGAAPAAVRRAFQRHALTVTAFGMLLGGLLSYALRRAIDSWLYRTTSTDVTVWALVATVLLASAMAAAALPAWRAARLNPADTLRSE